MVSKQNALHVHGNVACMHVCVSRALEECIVDPPVNPWSQVLVRPIMYYTYINEGVRLIERPADVCIGLSHDSPKLEVRVGFFFVHTFPDIVQRNVANQTRIRVYFVCQSCSCVWRTFPGFHWWRMYKAVMLHSVSLTEHMLGVWLYAITTSAVCSYTFTRGRPIINVQHYFTQKNAGN